MSTQHPQFVTDRKVKVFLSSTFKDMGAERDYLAKNTFLELEAESSKRSVSLLLRDLRWGITQQESEDGKVPELCLQEIDESSPFFIGIIGDRYGWTPRSTDFADYSQLYQRYPWIKEDFEQGVSITEIEHLYGVLRRKEQMHAYFYIKRSTQTVEPAEETDEQRRLRLFRQKLLAQDRYPVRYYDSPEHLGQMIKADLLHELDEFFPVDANLSDYAQMQQVQKSIIRVKTASYYPFAKTLRAIDDFMLSPGQLLAVVGDSGSGKSSLLAYWIQNYSRLSPYRLFYHMVDSANNCNDFRVVLSNLYIQILNRFGRPIPVISVDEDKSMVTMLNELIDSLGMKFVFVIDALNQLNPENDAHLLGWLPRLTPNVKIVCSTTSDNPTLLYALRSKSAQFYEIPLLDDFDEMYRASSQYLYQNYGKKLEPAYLRRVYDNPLFRKPLHLFSLLEELRLWGNFDQLSAVIDRFVSAQDSTQFFRMLIERLKADTETERGDVMAEVLILLALSRCGVSESEVGRILGYPDLFVSSAMHRCYRFISVYGGMTSISHNIITQVILGYYHGTSLFAAVNGKYRDYLELRRKSDDNFIACQSVLDLCYLYHTAEDKQHLLSLCSEPATFYRLHSLAGYGGNQKYWAYLFRYGYSPSMLLPRLEAEFHEADSIMFVLFHIRQLCKNINDLEGQHLAVEYSIAYLQAHPTGEDHRHELPLLFDQLYYYSGKGDYEHGVTLADQMIALPSDDEHNSYRALAYQIKAKFLENRDIPLAIECLQQAVSLFSGIDEIEGLVVSLINLGLNSARISLFEQAQQAYLQAQGLIQKHVQERPILTLQLYFCLSNLAVLYLRQGLSGLSSRYQRMTRECYKDLKESPFISILRPDLTFIEMLNDASELLDAEQLDEGYAGMQDAFAYLEANRSNLSESTYWQKRFDGPQYWAKDLIRIHREEEAYRFLSDPFPELLEAYHRHPHALLNAACMYAELLGVVAFSTGRAEEAIRYFDLEAELTRTSEHQGWLERETNILIMKAQAFAQLHDIPQALQLYDACLDQYLALLDTNDALFSHYVEAYLRRHTLKQFAWHLGDIDNNTLLRLLDELRSIHQIDSEFGLIARVAYVCLQDEPTAETEQMLDSVLSEPLICERLLPKVLLGAMSLSLAKACHSLARKYYEARNLNKALHFVQQSICLYGNVSEAAHDVDIAAAYQTMANILDSEQTRRESYKCYEKALSLFDHDHLHEEQVFRKASILSDFGIALSYTDAKTAEQKLLEGVQLLKPIYEHDSSNAVLMAEIQQTLGNIYDTAGNPAEAEKMYRAAIFVLELQDISDHGIASRLGNLYNNYAIMLSNQREYEQALEKLEISRRYRLDVDLGGLIRTDDTLFRICKATRQTKKALFYLAEIIRTEDKLGVLECNLLNEFVNYVDMFANICLQNLQETKAQEAYKRVFELTIENALRQGHDPLKDKNVAIVLRRINELFGDDNFLFEE